MTAAAAVGVRMGELPSLWLMITKDGFYPIQPSERCKPEGHGLLNDHVVRIEDVDGKVLWQRPDPAPNPLSQPYAGWGNDNGDDDE